MLSYSPAYESQCETDRECAYYSCCVHCVRVTSRHCVNRTRRVGLSSAASGLVMMLVIVASVCLRPCDGGLNCADHNISCYHGTCVEVKMPLERASHPVSIVCLCDDHWIGPACDVFSCSGRTL